MATQAVVPLTSVQTWLVPRTLVSPEETRNVNLMAAHLTPSSPLSSLGRACALELPLANRGVPFERLRLHIEHNCLSAGPCGSGCMGAGAKCIPRFQVDPAALSFFKFTSPLLSGLAIIHPHKLYHHRG